MNSILAQYGLPYKYPKNVEDAANKISGEITEQDYKEREDFRKVFTCTIDPKYAKDFDDALSIQRLENGNGRWVSTSLMFHTTSRRDSIIDKEAVKRATSVYLAIAPSRCSLSVSVSSSVRFALTRKIWQTASSLNPTTMPRSRTTASCIPSSRATDDINMKRYRNSSKPMARSMVPANRLPAETKEHPYQGENALQLITLDDGKETSCCKIEERSREVRPRGTAFRYSREGQAYQLLLQAL